MSRQAGISLLESLVAMSILAVAVLGMLGVQLRALAETQTSVRRAQSVRLIEDFAERIKTHPQGFGPPQDQSDEPGPMLARADCRIAACDAGMLAHWDLAAWKLAIADTLPRGAGQVFANSGHEAGRGELLGVMVAWRANERTEGDAAYRKALVVDSPAGLGLDCPTGLICHLAHVQP
ncbi:type IV pilus modification protein PilV [Variovorax sp. J31P207]|uniref:type IV pilus modification protein PilV n=1 Tax=Variovorax sp. J31P207 TaxID=3053510 RepID=UPI00257612B7|nr:type IV pilus modification protein PilV [Variovorax sp. J31P207]MDM0068015.1 type IV pilus modification protein PilV [Variovorax sp. J31P207]